MSAGPYWPWWLGAASLALATVGCCVVARRPLGVSGILARFVTLRAELEAERRRRALASDEAALEEALLAATAEAFGPAAVRDASGASEARPGEVPGAPRRGCADCAAARSRPTLGVHAVFLGAIVLGGVAGRLGRGGWAPTLDMGQTFARLFGRGAAGAVALALGGVLVGLGTSISGGCSTGHGLSGCSRLQPAGVAATVSYFGAAVLVSFLLDWRLS